MSRRFVVLAYAGRPAALEAGRFRVMERREPSPLVDGCLLITGGSDGTTDFERGMPAPHQARDGAGWRHDPLVPDGQALVVHVRGRGLVVLTGCGHAGAVNTVRHAMRSTGVRRLQALLGGSQLGGPAFEPITTPAVQALAEPRPALIAPGHCTGWRAQAAFAAALPAGRAGSVEGGGGTRTARLRPLAHAPRLRALLRPRRRQLDEDDYSQPADTWMEPLVRGRETELVEIPANWYLDDLPPMMFIKTSPNSHGFVNPRDIEQMWTDQFDWVYREQDYAAFTMTIHPDVAGRPQVLMALEQIIAHIKGHDGVRWVTFDEIAQDFLRRSPRPA